MTADIGALTNPYDVAVGPEVQGQDRRHRRLAHRDGAWCCCEQGITDINTASAADLKMVGEQLQATGAGDRQPKVTITMYNDLPAGQIGICADVVGRHHQRAVLPAQGHVGSESCATGSPRTARAWSTTT